MDALEKSLARSQAVVGNAHARALQLKGSGLLDLAPSQGFAQLNSFRDQGAQRERYGLFRGWLYAAINALASEAAGQPVSVGKMLGAEPKESERSRRPNSSKMWTRRKMTSSILTKAARQELEVMADHPLIDLLDTPNSIQHRWQFVYSFVSNLCLTGWSFVIGGETEDGLEMYSVPTTWVRPVHDKGPFAQFKIINPQNPSTQEAELVGRENVAFAHLPNPSDPMGAIAPAASQMMAIRIDDHIQTSQERFFENGVFPSVIVTIGKDPHPDVAYAGTRPRLTGVQRRQVVGAIRKVMSGVANYGNPAIVDGLIEKIDRLSATQNEMGWEKSELTVRTRILSAFGVHPYILGEPVSVGGYAQAAKIEERFCKRVNTYLDMLSTIVTNFAAPMAAEGEKMLVWWEKCEPHDPSLYWQNLREARKNGDVTQNELRAELGFPPDEDRNEGAIQQTQFMGIVQLLIQLGSGAVTRDQGVAMLEGLGLRTELAERIAGGQVKLSGGPVKTVEEEELAEATEELKEVVAILRTSPTEIVGKLMRECEVNVKFNPYHSPEDGRFVPALGAGLGVGGSVLGGGAPAPAPTPAPAPPPAPTAPTASTEVPKDRSTARKRGGPAARQLANVAKMNRRLSVDSAEGIKTYTSDEHYTRLNKELRTGKSPDKVKPQPEIAAFQKLAQQPLKQPTTVYRGVSDGLHDSLLAGLKQGGEISMKGFVSTSLDPKVAVKFASDNAGRTVLEIKAKRGVSVNDYSRFPNEYELVQAHGTRYKYVGTSDSARVDGKDGVRVVMLEEI